jgi:LCP family protein required for cell wall assembly
MLATPERLAPTQRTRRAVALVLLTAVVPGLAQVVAGNRRLGRVGLRVWVGSVIAVVLLGLVGLVRRMTLLGFLSRSWVLAVLEVVCFALAALWLVLFLDTLRLVRIGLLAPRAKAVIISLVACCLALTSGGMTLLASNIGAGRDFVSSVFGGNQENDLTGGRYNILLLGGDSGADRVGTRPDTIILVSIDAQTGTSVMFGFARDTEQIHFPPESTMARLMPKGYDCGDKCLLNYLYTWGVDHKSEFPAGTKNAGAQATIDAVEGLSGLDINYFALIDLKGFAELIDALGGLTINVKSRTAIGGIGSPISGYIEPGVQHLNGQRALWYARSRVQSDNYARMARQRCVIDAMVHQFDPLTVITKFRGIATAGKDVVQTDIPESLLGPLADLAIKARSQKIRTVNFVPPLMKPWSYDARFVTTTVAQTIEASENPPVATRSATSSRPSGNPTATSPAVADDLSSVCDAG